MNVTLVRVSAVSDSLASSRKVVLGGTPRGGGCERVFSVGNTKQTSLSLSLGPVGKYVACVIVLKVY